MAYFLGPLLGGEIAQYIGFSSLMSFIGVLNLCYGIYLMFTVLNIFQPKVCIAVNNSMTTSMTSCDERIVRLFSGTLHGWFTDGK